MKKGILIAVGVVVLFGVIFGGCLVSKYNSMVDKETEVDKALADIQVQLKRRAELIPNLVETVKGFASQEKEIFSEVANARSRLIGASNEKNPDPKNLAAANQQVGSALNRLLAISERYPDLKSNQNFTRLQDELAGTENRIAVARTRYNEAVSGFNKTIKRFPNSMIAGMGGFESREYFEAEAGDKEVPDVSFEGGGESAAGGGQQTGGEEPATGDEEPATP